MTPTYASSPLRRMDVSVRIVDDEVLILDRPGGQIHQLNRTAGYIWERCNGQLTSVDIASQLAQDFEITAEVALPDILLCLEQFHTHHLLKTDTEALQNVHSTQNQPKAQERATKGVTRWLSRTPPEEKC